jgi:hypothetical protein
MGQEHLFGNRAPFPKREELQTLVLFLGQVEGHPSHLHSLRLKVNDEITTSHDRLGVCCRASQDGVNAGDKLIFVEGLRQVVICPKAKPFDLTFDAGETR